MMSLILGSAPGRGATVGGNVAATRSGARE